MSYIDKLIQERLNGDETRVAELFYDETVINELASHGNDSDWYHFEPKTFDGEYFVRAGNGYACYQQDRGAKSNSVSFSNIHDAAVYFFTEAGYIKSVQGQQKRWWQFWK
ncbi:hypothetical protein [Cycloclasticus pugetii]|uniref:hypothetical protein n=1 Tax=Cycloclasticus pugetii TaxID=34068 RepID=UPI003A90F90D